MSSPTRLGDLLRVVAELRPDAADLATVARLLPAAGSESADRPAPSGPRPDQPTAAVGGGGRGRVRPPVPPARRRPGLRHRLPARDGLPERHSTRRRWMLLAIGTGAAIVVGAVAAGRLAVAAAVIVGTTAAALIPLVRAASRAGRTWWRSVHRHATAERTEPAAATATREPTGELSAELADARWQTPPPAAPLIRPSQRRAMATLLAGRRAPGEIDLVATVGFLARRQPMVTVPRHHRWRTNQGMQLHVDVGPALEPFRGDVDQLRRALVSVAAAHAVTELAFIGDPGRARRPGRWGPRSPGPVEPTPAPGTPVLVVTDLGIGLPRTGSPAPPEAFVAHHRALRRAGCRVVYLVPYPRRRWPAAVGQLPALYWADDLGATAALTQLQRLRRRP